MDVGSFFGTDKVFGEMVMQQHECNKYEQMHDLEVYHVLCKFFLSKNVENKIL